LARWPPPCDDAFVSKEDLLRKSAVVIVGVPHAAYRGLRTTPQQVVVDVWGILHTADTPSPASSKTASV